MATVAAGLVHLGKAIVDEINGSDDLGTRVANIAEQIEARAPDPEKAQLDNVAHA